VTIKNIGLNASGNSCDKRIPIRLKGEFCRDVMTPNALEEGKGENEVSMKKYTVRYWRI